ncbi:MAG: hypothetical protein Q4G24_16150 [Paracoccus sp. (in: a-proteobacteria)]|uniref:hypothetical protein n=1 Tax=Paracoccus sp. TaxID=267 RepID=UPI0026DFCA75|nr:hypothetical protein [Paracoccus sp. (in: a-proteobacteria)]MDO5622979.1 hypothetical protein [Paracoccus sp. (in: a-proteobacteria)]
MGDLEGLGQFRLHRILAISEYGKPVLEGTNARVCCAGRARCGDIGRMAVCQDVMDGDERLIVVLGVLEDEGDPKDTSVPLRIENGAASLTLHPDGRIRLQGADIALDAEKGLSVLAGRIDLN